MTSQRRKDSYSPVLRSIETRTSASSGKRFLVAEASADSNDSNTISLSTLFSRDSASTSNKISRLITYVLQLITCLCREHQRQAGPHPTKVMSREILLLV